MSRNVTSNPKINVGEIVALQTDSPTIVESDGNTYIRSGCVVAESSLTKPANPCIPRYQSNFSIEKSSIPFQEVKYLNGQWVGFSSTTTNSVYTSTDNGTTWTFKSFVKNTTEALKGIFYFNSYYYLIFSGLYNLYRSTDLISWSLCPIGYAISTNALMVYDSVSNTYILTGDGQSSYVNYSVSGDSWEAKTVSFSSNIKSLINNPTSAGGYIISLENNSHALFSSDGITWNRNNYPSLNSYAGHVRKVVKHSTLKMWCGISSYNNIVYSTNGINWNNAIIDVGAQNVNDIIVFNGFFVAALLNNAATTGYCYVLVSPDGINFSRKSWIVASWTNAGTGSQIFGVNAGQLYYGAYGSAYYSLGKTSLTTISDTGAAFGNPDNYAGNNLLLTNSSGYQTDSSCQSNKWDTTYMYTTQRPGGVIYYATTSFGPSGASTTPSYATTTNYGSYNSLENGSGGTVQSVSMGLKLAAQYVPTQQETNNALCCRSTSYYSTDSAVANTTKFRDFYASSKHTFCNKDTNTILYANGQFAILVDLVTNTYKMGTFPTNNIHMVAYGAGKYVALVRRRDATAHSLCYYSTDGVTWSAGASGNIAPGNWNVLKYDNNQFMAICGSEAASGLCSTSTDGVTWTTGGALASATWGDVAYGNGRWIAIATGDASTAASWSVSGASWNAITMTSRSWSAIAYNSQQQRWGAINSGTTENAGSTSALFVSTDASGTTWGQMTTTSGFYTSLVAYGNDFYYGTMATSKRFSIAGSGEIAMSGGPQPIGWGYSYGSYIFGLTDGYMYVASGVNNLITKYISISTSENTSYGGSELTFLNNRYFAFNKNTTAYGCIVPYFMTSTTYNSGWVPILLPISQYNLGVRVYITTMWYDSSISTYYLALNTGEIMKSTDATTWTAIKGYFGTYNNGAGINATYTLAVSGSNIYGVTASGGYIASIQSSAGLDTPSKAVSAAPTFSYFKQSNGKHYLFNSSQLNKLIYSTDFQNWYTLASEYLHTGKTINSISIDNSGNAIAVLTAGSSVFLGKSTNLTTNVSCVGTLSEGSGPSYIRIN